MCKKVAAILLCFFSFYAFGQYSKIDDLKNVISKDDTNSKEVRLKTLKLLLAQYQKTNSDLDYKYGLLSSIAKSFHILKEKDSAIKYCNLILKSIDNRKRKSNVTSALQVLSSIYLEEKQYGKAKKALYDLAKDTINYSVYGYSEDKKKECKLYIYNGLSVLFEKQKEYEKSLEYLKKKIKLNNSIQDKVLVTNFSDIEVKYRSELKEKLQLKEDYLEQEKIINKANFQKGLLAIFLLIVTISTFFIWKRYQMEINAKRIVNKQKENIEHQKNLIEKLQKELHHRIKNNLSFIDLFINLAKGKFPNKEYTNKLNELQNRIHSMFEIHKQLLKKDDVTSVNAKNYIDVLVKNVKESYIKNNICLNNNTNENETLLANISFPVGIIVNEFVTNSYKYAFIEDEKGTINIALKSDKKNYHLSLVDNGKGLPKDFNIESLNSFGLETIQLLTKEYNGTFSISGTKGVKMKIILPKNVA
ncbi:sensor histidine kinase [uncultured Polaribacter sp.]|uniref:tetratricopeptide repeat-containing sensor histidine kinase n=1 Tax=uncultured Polaribacter sp. TaxID=174711 RepID=UPI0026082662|nr:sensor histidine kinase [uncultured Polaribacter sp.]